MKLEDKKLIADEGLCLRRKGTTFIIGPSITLAKWDGKDDVPENFEEVVAFNVGYNSVGINPAQCDNYDTLVSALIHTKYSVDNEVALINNALEDIANLADNAEYKEYQEWRSKCKETAKTYLKKDEEGQAE